MGLQEKKKMVGRVLHTSIVFYFLFLVVSEYIETFNSFQFWLVFVD